MAPDLVTSLAASRRHPSRYAASARIMYNEKAL
jgi:hypothetical protein